MGTFPTPPHPVNLKQIINAFSPSEREAAQIALGFACDCMVEWLRDRMPDLLVPGEDHPLRRASGLVNLIATSPMSKGGE